MALEQDGLFDAPDTPPRLMYSQAKAAKLCDVAPSTIRRYRQSGKLEGCEPDEKTGGWLIPASSLVAAGLMPRSTPPDPVPTPSVALSAPPHDDTQQTALEALINELKEKLMRAEHRAELAEAIANERGQALEAERKALRAITSASAETEQAPKKRRRWFWRN